MTDRKVITMCHCSRPDYTRRVLDALRLCEGIGDYLILPHLEPGNEAVLAEIETIDFAECQPTVNATRLGVNRNTENALLDGFGLADYVIHVEDDIVLAPDSLVYYEWCARRYRSDDRVFSVTTYNRRMEPATPADYHLVRLRKWFHPWGWATWRNRWETFSGRLYHCAMGWDVLLNTVHCNGGQTPRCHEVYPELSRSQNIGIVSSRHYLPPEWLLENHHLKHWAGQVDLRTDEFHE